MTELLIETDHTCAFYQKGESDFLMITFGHMGKPGRRTFWGQSATEKLGFNCIGLVPKHPHWYPADDFSELLKAILPISQKFTEVICYGFSMGGYAAIKFSKRVNATSVIAFSPQASINPKFVQNIDRRYVEFFNGKLHKDMELSIGDCIDGAFLVCDPNFAPDVFHAGAISSVANIEMVLLPKVKHQTIDVVASSEKLSKVIDVIRSNASGAAEILSSDLCSYRDSLELEKTFKPKKGH